MTAEFGAYHAGAHSSSRSRALFDPPRAEVLSARHGWAVDPGVVPTAGRSVAIEVYPHPAMVTLFGLATVLPYKRKRGRTVASCREALLRLMDLMDEHLEGPLLLSASERWGELRHAVAAAHRPMHLAAVEDEIDGIFCAYLAWLWGRRDPRMRVIGDATDGYIVVPGYPTVPPAPRPRPGRAQGQAPLTKASPAR